VSLTPNDFQQNVLKTECSITDDTRERLSRQGYELTRCLATIVNQADNLDVLKKYIYYNRQNEAATALPFRLEPEEDARLKELARLLHSISGIITEGGELAAEALRYITEGGELDKVNLMEEYGDTSYYVAQGSNEVGYTLEETLVTNNTKLEARYKGGFSENAANNRNLDVERKILEDGSENVNT
jgi:NTP pyrophosphatase (non-canonical NTP hydrolase)